MGALDKPKRDLITPLKVRNPKWIERMTITLRKAGADV
jgi:hypothetical protein